VLVGQPDEPPDDGDNAGAGFSNARHPRLDAARAAKARRLLVPALVPNDPDDDDLLIDLDAFVT